MFFIIKGRWFVCLFLFFFVCLLVCLCFFTQVHRNSWTNYDQQLINLWSTGWLTHDKLYIINKRMIYLFVYFFVVFTVTQEWLLHNQQFFNWSSIFDQLLINTWSTDDQHLIKWRWTVYQLMITDESTVHQLYNR